MSDIVEHVRSVAKRADSSQEQRIALGACAVEIERLRELVDTRDERLRKVESDLFDEKRLRRAEAEMLRGIIAARDAEIAKLKEADRA